MIAAWMAAATLLALLLGVAALAVERALRTLGRQARAPWLVALAVAIVWPVIAPLAAARLAKHAGDGTPVTLPAVRSTISAIAPTLPPLSEPWIGRVDAAVVALWAIASAVLLVRLVLALFALSGVARRATREIVAGVPVLVTPTIGPAVFGVRQPRLLVPRWLLDLDATLRALVLHHEQEHCEARDPQVTLAAALAVSLVPWNVGVWWIARRLRLALELDCDLRVLRRGEETERYGKLLLFIAQRQSQTRLASMLAESNSHLSRRITAMNAARPANPRLRVALLTLVAAAALACSTRYAGDLTTARSAGERSTSERATSTRSQDAPPTYFSPAGAKPARPANAPAPVYPAALRSARVEGEVLVTFVVDSSGLVVPGSIKVLRSSDSLFTEAVRRIAPDMRFHPPEYNGRRVRQLVQQLFFFDVKGSAASSSRKSFPAAKPTTDPTNRSPMMLRPIVTRVP